MFCFCCFHWFVPGWFFCVVFDSLVFVVGFVGSYYFVKLVVLMSILFVFSLVLMRGNTMWFKYDWDCLHL